jgi:hypothetical protein
MSLNPMNLDAITRTMMVAEIEQDSSTGRAYLSPRLNERGTEEWVALLREAAQRGDDVWLASEIRTRSLLNETEQRRKPKGGYTQAKVGINAPDMLAEGEFNRLYMRGLARRAISEGKNALVVYRAKDVANPRPDSEAKIGTTVDPQKLLDDLRANIGVDTALGLPAGPNSGLSVHL